MARRRKPAAFVAPPAAGNDGAAVPPQPARTTLITSPRTPADQDLWMFISFSYRIRGQAPGSSR